MKSNFKESYKHLGTVKANSKKEIIFEGNGILPEIKLMTASCACTKPVRKGNNIKVVFRPGGFPKHLIGASEYMTQKNVVIYYKDGSQEILKFKALISKL